MTNGDIIGAIRLVPGRGRAALTSGIALDLIISLGYLITAVVVIGDQHRSAFGGAIDGVSQAFASILANNDVVDIQSILTDDGVDIRIMLMAIIVTTRAGRPRPPVPRPDATITVAVAAKSASRHTPGTGSRWSMSRSGVPSVRGRGDEQHDRGHHTEADSQVLTPA